MFVSENSSTFAQSIQFFVDEFELLVHWHYHFDKLQFFIDFYQAVL